MTNTTKKRGKKPNSVKINVIIHIKDVLISVSLHQTLVLSCFDHMVDQDLIPINNLKLQMPVFAMVQ